MLEVWQLIKSCFCGIFHDMGESLMTKCQVKVFKESIQCGVCSSPQPSGALQFCPRLCCHRAWVVAGFFLIDFIVTIFICSHLKKLTF